MSKFSAASHDKPAFECRSARRSMPGKTICAAVTGLLFVAALGGLSVAGSPVVPGEKRVTVNGQALDVTWDPDTRTPRTISAVGSDLLEVRNIESMGRQEVNDIGALLVRKYYALLRIRSDQLVLRQAEKTEGTWYVSYQQTVRGMAVHDSSLGFSIDAEGRIKSLGVIIYPDVHVPAAVKVGRAQALRTAQVHLRDAGKSAYDVSAESVGIYPEKKAGSIDYRQVYIFNFFPRKGTHPASAAGGHAVFVDAQTGLVVRTQTLVKPLGCCLPKDWAPPGQGAD